MGIIYKCIYCGKKIKHKSRFIGNIKEFNKYSKEKEKELSDECECQKGLEEETKEPFQITKDNIKEGVDKWNNGELKSSVSYMNEWQKYKNKYSRILMDAKEYLKRNK